MSIERFFQNVRRAASPIVPTLPERISDSPLRDASEMKAALRGTAGAFTAESVAGFDEGEYSFLDRGERDRLKGAVNRIRKSRSPLKTELPREFLDIVNVIRPDRYGDADALVLGKRLEAMVRGKLPEWVRELRFRTGLDHVGDPAIWIWVVLDDAAAADDVIGENGGAVRDVLRRSFERLESDRFPYIQVRAVSELGPEVEESDA